MHVYNEKKIKWGEKKYKMQFEKKKQNSTGKFHVGAKACAERAKQIKGGLIYKRMKEGCPQGKTPPPSPLTFEEKA